MRLTREIAEEIEKSVRHELATQADREGLVSTCDQLIKLFATAATRSDPKQLLAQVFRVIWFFESATPKVNASHKTSADLTRIAEYSLNILGVRPYKSKLSFLHRALYDAKAQFFSNRQDPWLSVWSLQVGDAMDGTESVRNHEEHCKALVVEANQYLRCGFVSDAISLFQKAESFAQEETKAWEIRLNVVRCLRILNEVNLALDVIATMQSEESMPEEIKASVAWETALLTSQRDQDVTPILEQIKEFTKSSLTIHAEYLPLAVLWAYASKQRSFIEKLPKAAWIKSRIKGSKDEKDLTSSLKLISHLEDFYLNDQTIFNKIKHVGEVLGTLRLEAPSPELAVFFAAVARWLMRSKQRRTAALAINIYQSLSVSISNGRTATLFGLLEDISDSLNASAESSRTVVLTQGVKTGIERTLLYVQMITKLCKLAIVYTLKKYSVSGDADRYKQDAMVKVSEFLVKYASGAMKGPIHKLGQAALNFLTLPQEAEQNFKSVLWSKSIVHESLMRRVLEEDLKQNLDDVFSEFNWDPVGVGSVSQVYRAKLKTGEDVAVKIQYPDLAKIVKQDTDVFTRLMLALRGVFPREDARALSKCLFDLYEREINFLTELEAAEILNTIIAKGARWRIPRFYKHLCSQRVLVSEFISGQNFYEFSETASTSEKVEIGKAIHHFFMLSVIEGNIIYIDPHPANLIISDGEIVMVDFGCFMPATPDLVTFYREMILSYQHAFDREQLLDLRLELYRKSGIIGRHPDVGEQDIRAFVDVVSQQLNWELCTQPGLKERLDELYLKQGVNKVFGSKNPEFGVGFIATLLMMRTINKFGIPHSVSFNVEFAHEIQSRLDNIDYQVYPRAG